jgi:hypothetical protein
LQDNLKLLERNAAESSRSSKSAVFRHRLGRFARIFSRLNWRSKFAAPRGPRLDHQMHDLAAESLLESFGDLDALETPAPEMLVAEVLTMPAALPVVAVAVPRIDGVERRAEAPIRYGELHNERKFPFIDARCHLLFSKQIAHDELLYADKPGGDIQRCSMSEHHKNC